MQTENGILALVPGDCVALGSRGLPDPESATADEMSVEVDAQHAGRVLITYRRTFYKRGKHSHWYWRAVMAVCA